MRLRDLIEPRELLYPSNLLTLSRLVLVPATLVQLRRPEHRRSALIYLSLAMLTDALDGPVARSRGEVSRLGKLIDPLADKLLIDGSAIILAQTRGFPWWATGLLLFRDAGIVAAALVVLSRRDEITPSAGSGKLTTVLLTAATLLYIADGPRSGKPALYLAMLPFGLSFVEYGRHFMQIMTGRTG